MKIIVATVGSLGDLMPFMVAAEALRIRGHRITFATNRGYEAFIRQSGFEFAPVWDDRNLQRGLDDTLLSDPHQAWDRVQKDLFEMADAPTYEVIQNARQSGECAVLSSWSATGATRAHRELGIPLCRAYLSPHALTLAGITAPGSRELAFFPEWFGARQANWPPGLRYAGFPLYDDAVLPPLPPPLETFLAEGDPPVVFTPGSFMRQSDKFFRESQEACVALGLRAVFLTPYGAENFGGLPKSILHFKYVPLQRLLPRAAALVYHGGIGTCAQAMRAAIPHLTTPLFFDQFDNARIVEELGIGHTLPARDYNASQAAQALGQMLRSETMKDRCVSIAARFRNQDAAAIIRDTIEAVA